MKERITEIREFKTGARVTVGDRTHLLLTRRDMRAFALREGDEVNAEELAQELLQAQYPNALNRAVRLLAVRARSVREVEKRLTDAFYLPETAEMVITKLTMNGLLDDETFAGQWARDRMSRQIGKTRILYELRQKGVDEAIAQCAIEALTRTGRKAALKRWQRSCGAATKSRI